MNYLAPKALADLEAQLTQQMEYLASLPDGGENATTLALYEARDALTQLASALGAWRGAAVSVPHLTTDNVGFRAIDEGDCEHSPMECEELGGACVFADLRPEASA